MRGERNSLMVRKLRTLAPLNAQIQIARERYFAEQVYVDLIDRILVLRHPVLGEVSLSGPSAEAMCVRYLDLTVPPIIRCQQHEEGWEDLTLKGVLDLAQRTLLSEE